MVFHAILLLIAFPFIIFSVVVQGWIHHVYVKNQSRANPQKLTGEKAARILLDNAGLQDTAICQSQGELSDGYDAKSDTVRLSPLSHNGRSLTSLAVTGHEVGHAMQAHEKFLPAKIRRLILPALNVLATLAFPMALIGIVFNWNTMANTAVLLYAGVVLIHLLMLPIEINAGHRALARMKEAGMVTQVEEKPVKTVMHAAAMNYIALSMIAFGSLRNMFAAFRGRSNG